MPRLRLPHVLGVAASLAACVAGVGLLLSDPPGSTGADLTGSAGIDTTTDPVGAPSTTLTSAVVETEAETARQVLAGLSVKGRAPKTGYTREEFGHGWADTDHDGCSTREEILQRDLTGKTYRGSGRCHVIASGRLDDPYSGHTITFERGPDTSPLVQIDHVVALADAWQKGAQHLTPAQREALANDPLNLLAVDGTLNQQKSASDAATWLPPNKAYRCQYVARQVAVKAKYNLWVTHTEKTATDQTLTNCPTQPIPQT